MVSNFLLGKLCNVVSWLVLCGSRCVVSVVCSELFWWLIVCRKVLIVVLLLCGLILVIFFVCYGGDGRFSGVRFR